MPWREQEFWTWAGSLVSAAIIGLVTMVFKNHYSLIKHQRWVANNYPDKKEFCEKLDASVTPLKEQMQSQDNKIELILQHLLEHKDESSNNRKVDKS